MNCSPWNLRNQVLSRFAENMVRLFATNCFSQIVVAPTHETLSNFEDQYTFSQP